MDQIVAPAIQLQRGIGRPVELEEAAIDRMGLWQRLQAFGAENLGHLRLERAGEQAVYVMVAIIHQDEAAIADIALEIAPLGLRKFDQLVPRHVAERRGQHLRVRKSDDMLLRIDPQRRVIDQRGDEV